MAFLFSSPKNNAATTPTYTGMQLQSSAYGLCIPVVYGTTRIGWNLLDYYNFQQVSTPQSSGGKGGIVGGGGKGGNSSTISYYATVLGLLCEGPITGIYSSWLSQTQTAGAGSFDFLSGALAQSPWSGAQHSIGYSGLAYMAGENVDLGSSANLPAMNWEAQAFLEGTAPGTYGGNGCAVGGDADPSLVIPDMLSNGQYGIGFPSTRIGEVVSNNEAYTCSTSITVAHNGSAFQYNLSVLDVTTGTLLVCVASSPGSGQYSVSSTGVYTFNSAQTGNTINIRYVSTQALLTYQNFCIAAGLWISPAYVSQSQTSALLDDIATATYSEVVWSSGVLQMKPRGTQQINANGKSYTPNTTPLFNLTDDDFMPNTGSPASSPRMGVTGSIGGGNGTDDPVQLVRGRKSDQINDVKIECLDRANQYAPFVAEATDMGLISRYGRRAAASKTLHIFADINACTTAANFQLQDQYIMNLYCFQLDQRYGLLDPMDLVTINDPDFSGISTQGVRLYDLVENDDGSVVVSAEEFPGTIGAPPTYNVDTSDGYIQDFDVDPGDAATPAIFDVPVQMVQVIGLETWLATHSATGNVNWGGCDIYLSTDGTSYFKRGTLTGASRMGTLTSNFASGSDPDTVNTLAVDLTNSQGVLEGGTQNDADTATTICFVDGEYVSYEQATLTATYKYNLGKSGSTPGYLRRGQWGSQIASHLSGSLFVRLDGNVFDIPYTNADKGRTIHIKLVSFNIYGGGYQNLSTVTAYTHTIGGPPAFYGPSGLTASPLLNSIGLVWTDAPDVGIAGTEIWRSSTSSFSGASKISVVADYGTTYVDGTTSPGTQYWYWVRHVDIAGNTSSYTPSTGGAGATATPAQVSQAMIQAGAVGSAQLQTGIIPGILVAEGLAAPVVVTTLPVNDSVTGPLVFLTTDNQIYRWTGSAWTVAVPTVNLTGQVASSNLTAGQVTANSMAANSITASGMISANAITAGTIAAGAVNIGSIIVGNIIVTGHLVANAVSNMVAANAVSSDASVGITTDPSYPGNVLVMVFGEASNAGTFDIWRNGSSISPFGGYIAASAGQTSAAYMDSPGAGSFTYTAASQWSSGLFSQAWYASTIVAVELKR